MLACFNGDLGHPTYVYLKGILMVSFGICNGPWALKSAYGNWLAVPWTMLAVLMWPLARLPANLWILSHQLVSGALLLLSFQHQRRPLFLDWCLDLEFFYETQGSLRRSEIWIKLLGLLVHNRDELFPQERTHIYFHVNPLLLSKFHALVQFSCWVFFDAGITFFLSFPFWCPILYFFL